MRYMIPSGSSKQKFGGDVFAAVKSAAQGQIEALALDCITGKSRKSGDYLLMLNPTRADRNVGSFYIHTKLGFWADAATGDRGGDIIAFYAYIYSISQLDAAKMLAARLGVSA